MLKSGRMPTMVDEIQSAPAPHDPVDAIAEPNAETPAPAPGSIPAVGDVLHGSVVRGVRKLADGGCDISFNGVDWQPVS
jgi:hypothetical protein